MTNKLKEFFIKNYSSEIEKLLLAEDDSKHHSIRYNYCKLLDQYPEVFARILVDPDYVFECGDSALYQAQSKIINNEFDKPANVIVIGNDVRKCFFASILSLVEQIKNRKIIIS